MTRKLSLPTHGRLLDLVAPPTVDVMRARLGGRAAAASSGAVGDAVSLGEDAPPRPGVVLASDGAAVDVYVDHGTVRRTRAAEVRPWLGELPPALRDVARDARVFASLREGQPVRFATGAGAVEEGTLLEKCRWGGLVRRGDGVVVGVGFRRVTPVAPPGPAS